MKKLTSFLLLAAVVFSTVSCKKDLIGEGPIVTETRSVPAFNAIDLRMNGNVYFTKSATTSVEVSAKQSLMPMLETAVSGNRLVIRYTNGKTYDNDESIRINISAPDVNSFELNTSGSIFCMSDIQPAGLFLKTGGSGSIHMKQVTTGALEAISTVSGDIHITGGSATSEKLKTSASGNIDVSALSANTVTALTSGSGDIRLKVLDNLNATISGSGDIYFRGSPVLSTHISGSGNLIRY